MQRATLATGLLALQLAGCAPAITGDEETLSLDSESTGSTYDILVRTPPGGWASRSGSVR